MSYLVSRYMKKRHLYKLIFKRLYSPIRSFGRAFVKKGPNIVNILKTTNKPIVLFVSNCDYFGGLYQRPHHVITALAKKGYVCLWPDKFLSRPLQISANLYLFPSCFLKKLLKKDFPKIIHLYNHHYAFQGVEKYLPKAIKNSYGVWMDYVDSLDLKKDLGIRKKIEKILTYCANDPRTLFTVTADSLVEEAIGLGVKKNQILVSKNAVNPYDFPEGINRNIPSVFKKILAKKKPVIGYYGALSDDWFDFDLSETLIKNHSEYEFVFLGSKFGYRANDLEKYKNYNYIPAVSYKELPDYACNFDVAIIPFQINSITKGCSPVKLFEYMTMKLPIVTTPMPECKSYKSVLIADDASSFAKAISKALTLKKETQFQKMLKEEALNNTWDKRVDDICKKLDKMCMNRGC